MSTTNNSPQKDRNPQDKSQQHMRQPSSEETLPPEIKPSNDPQSEFSVEENLSRDQDKKH